MDNICEIHATRSLLKLVVNHPLVAAADRAVAAGESDEFLAELLEEQHYLKCRHAAPIVVLSDGKILCQKRREGLQTFGGGKYSHSICNKAHSVRRELLMEANIVADTTAVAIQRITPPCLIYDAVEQRATLVQIFVVDASHFESLEDGTFEIAKRKVWSRETAWWSGEGDAPSSRIWWGQFFGGAPIFRLVDASDVITRESEFRPCDWRTYCKMLPQIGHALRGELVDSTTFVVRGDDQQYVRKANEFLHTLSRYAEDAFIAQWDLIPSKLLYRTLHHPEWRRALLKHLRARSAARTSRGRERSRSRSRSRR